jgi:hypothetical protein
VESVPFLIQGALSLEIAFLGGFETLRQATEKASARERIRDASYELFSQRGIPRCGVNEVIERAGVATTTLYRHFPQGRGAQTARLAIVPAIALTDSRACE